MDISRISSSSAQMAQLLNYAQSASTEMAEKMIKVAATLDSTVYAEMTGIGQALDLYA